MKLIRGYFKTYFFCSLNYSIIKLKPLVVCGPSGVGKGTLLEKIFKTYPNLFQLSVSSTTRQPRPGEIDGKHYFYISKEEFQKVLEQLKLYQEIQNEKFIEYCQVHGNFYGTHFSQLSNIQNQGKVCVLEIDVQGAEKVIKKMPQQCNYIFINGPSIETIKQRLIKRGTESTETINKRLNAAQREIEQSRKLGVFKEIVNDNLDQTHMLFLETLMNLYPQIIL